MTASADAGAPERLKGTADVILQKFALCKLFTERNFLQPTSQSGLELSREGEIRRLAVELEFDDASLG